MTVTITLTDPTADESRAVRAYLDALHGGTAVQHTERARAVEVRQTVYQTDEPDQTIGEALEIAHDRSVSAADAGAPDFDSAGMPWDERIHASSKATVADGTWRKKRGVSDELVADVEQELRALTQYEPTEEELNDAAAARGEPSPTDPEQEQSVPDAPSAPAQDAPPPPPAAEAPSPSGTFLDVMKRVTASGLNADSAKRAELLSAVGLKSLMDLSKQPDKIAEFMAVMDAEGL